MTYLSPTAGGTQYGEGVGASYRAEIVEAGDGVRLRPADDATIPTELNEVHLLGLAIALAMGAAGYEHHPEPRDAENQTIDALLAGEVSMPWRMARPPSGGAPPPSSGTPPPSGEARQSSGAAQASHLVCDRSDGAAWRCRIEPAQQ
jgi:hypothetical protein